MTKKEWAAEVEATLATTGSEWRVSKVWVEQTSPMMYADLTTAALGQVKRITLARDRFSTPQDRTVEILRQLYGDSPPDRNQRGPRKHGRQ